MGGQTSESGGRLYDDDDNDKDENFRSSDKTVAGWRGEVRKFVKGGVRSLGIVFQLLPQLLDVSAVLESRPEASVLTPS